MLFLFTSMIDTHENQLRFEDIYHSYRKQMLTVANRVLHNLEDAEDAVQNALLGIARNIRTLPDTNEKVVRAYVLTAAKNAALSLLPEKQRRDTTLDIGELNISANEDLFQQIVTSRDYNLLLRAMTQLESPYREVLLLVYVHGQSVNAAADILCRNRETVRKQLQRGKKMLIGLCRKEGICYGEEHTANL